MRPIKPTSAPTLEMVGAHAGVSRATVSRVVNGSPKVSPEIEAVVRQAIQELGYVPNRAARSLASKQAHAIALVVPENMAHFFGDLYFASIVVGINDRLQDSDYVLNLMVASEGRDGKTLRYLQGGNVDGAFVVSHHTSDSFLDALTDAIPVVFGGRPADHVTGGYVVDVDNVAGSRLAADHLVSLGRRRIAHIAGPSTMPAGIDRARGFRAALEDAGLTPGPIVEGDFTMRGGAEAMRAALAQDPQMDAVFIASDLMAAGAMSVLRAAGVRVPEDVAVVGYDDSDAATSSEVPLTTVRQPSEAMGAAMVDILLGVLRGEEDHPRMTILPTELILRASA